MAECCGCAGCAGENLELYRELDKTIEKYKGQAGALIQVLHKAQGIFGYLPKEVQVYVADQMDVPVTEVYGVVTFYAFFSMTPKGKHTIGICMGTACYVKGAGQILDSLKAKLKVDVGGTTEDGKFTLEVLRCIGACGLAPAVMIGDDVYGRLTSDKLDDMLAKYE
jgi:NADP-reducing hydrogenase subunit HndA